MTNEQAWLSRRYVIYKLFTNVWFLGSVWLYFYRLYITDQQVGILDGMAFAIGLLAEVPSGALADKFGRHVLVRTGHMCVGVGIIMQALGSSFLPFVVGQSLLLIGLSFVSGADDALFYERLQFNKESPAWRKLVTRGAQIGLMGSVFAHSVGGYLHTINPRIPWLITGFAFFIAVYVIWPIKDTRPKTERQAFLPELKSYFGDIKTGFLQFRLPRLWLYVPIIVTVQGIFYATGFGLLRLIFLSDFSFTPFQGGVVVASCSLITVGFLSYMHKHSETMSEKRVLTIIAVAAATSLLLATADIGKWGYAVILALYAGEHVLHPFMSEVLNRHAPERHRATVLSVASFLRMLPYVVLAPLIGALSTQGKLWYFLVAWSSLICVALLIYLALKRSDEKIHLAADS